MPSNLKITAAALAAGLTIAAPAHAWSLGDAWAGARRTGTEMWNTFKDVFDSSRATTTASRTQLTRPIVYVPTSQLINCSASCERRVRAHRETTGRWARVGDPYYSPTYDHGDANRPVTGANR